MLSRVAFVYANFVASRLACSVAGLLHEFGQFVSYVFSVATLVLSHVMYNEHVREGYFNHLGTGPKPQALNA